MNVLDIKSENIITAGNIKLYMCDICNEVYTMERSLKLHYRAHSNFSCEVCQETFFMKRDLTIHLRTHFGENKPKYGCSECDKEFLTRNQVLKHMKCHEEEQFFCKVCNAEFYCMKALKRHNIIHKTYVCDGCNASFHKKLELKRHVCASIVQQFKPSNATISYRKPAATFKQELIIDSETEKEISQYSDTSSVLKQKVTCNPSSPNRPFFCEKCEKSFRQNSSLVSHRCAIKKISYTQVKNRKKIPCNLSLINKMLPA